MMSFQFDGFGDWGKRKRGERERRRSGEKEKRRKGNNLLVFMVYFFATRD